LFHEFQPLLPTDTALCAFHWVSTGVELRALQTTTDKGVKVLVFSGLAGSPKQLVIYPRGAADGAVAV
jgi:hypothetical protein